MFPNFSKCGTSCQQNCPPLQYGIDGQLLTAIKSLCMYSEVLCSCKQQSDLSGKAALFHLFCTGFVYVDRIARKCKPYGGVKNSDCSAQHLLFADDLELLNSTHDDLQQPLGKFLDACCALDWKSVQRKQKPCAYSYNQNGVLSKLMKHH